MSGHEPDQLDLPGTRLDIARMPGHWLLARLGKRVLRPGGLEMTRTLLDRLAIASDDEVVEFAPGLGVTANRIVALGPRRYIGIERDPDAAGWTRRQLPAAGNIAVVVGTADHTQLPDACASVVLGEAMLSMNTPEHKQRIVAEAHRLLRPGGRYGIHELCIVPDDIDPAQQQDIDRDLSAAIHVGARPLRPSQWRELLEKCGFRVLETGYAPMHLLRPRRLLQDEGIAGTLRIARNLLLDGQARRRVGGMRKVFERRRKNLNAIYLVAQKR